MRSYENTFYLQNEGTYAEMQQPYAHDWVVITASSICHTSNSTVLLARSASTCGHAVHSPACLQSRIMYNLTWILYVGKAFKMMIEVGVPMIIGQLKVVGFSIGCHCSQGVFFSLGETMLSPSRSGGSHHYVRSVACHLVHMALTCWATQSGLQATAMHHLGIKSPSAYAVDCDLPLASEHSRRSTTPPLRCIRASLY